MWGRVGSCFAVCYCTELCFKVNPPQNTTAEQVTVKAALVMPGEMFSDGH